MYKDKDWLYYQYFEYGRTMREIGEEVGVSKTTIRSYIQKYGIPKPRPDAQVLVQIACHNCGKAVEYTLRYLKARIREGRFNLFCGETCKNKHHSEKMSGKGNPNFGGSFHGVLPSKLSPEEKARRAKIVSRTMRERGSVSGHKNPRWKGGERDVNCPSCKRTHKVRPYIYREIVTGKRKGFCSLSCATVYNMTRQKTSGTSIEIKMREELVKRGITYEEQYNLGGKFALDFYLPELNTVIECDGDYWHNLPEVKKRDKSKNAYIKACGMRLFRFWEHEINDDVSACVDKVEQSLTKGGEYGA